MEISKKTKNILAVIASTITILGAPLSADFLVNKVTGNPYNMKVMSQVQPWVFLYDKDNDREADTAMIGMVGEGTKVCYNREPTEKEKKWYREN